ncbi:MAG: hypothetical protein ACPGUU_03755 [Flavobacteriaceae bacterium]
MKKYWNLIFGILGIIIVTNTFLNELSVKRVFGFEINIWVYRVIWILITISSLYDFFVKQKMFNQK